MADTTLIEQEGSAVEERFAPGELTGAQIPQPDYGYCYERMPDEYVQWFKTLLQSIAREGIYTRIEEIRKTAISEFYWRSMFDVYFDQQAMSWSEGNSSNAGAGEDQGDISLSYPFNIYQSFGRAFIAKVGIIPKVKFECKDFNPDGQRLADCATCLLREIEEHNEVEVFAERVAREFWVSGRTGFYSRYVCDGARFGYYDEEHVDESKPEGFGAPEDGEEGAADEKDFKPPKKQPRKPKGGALIDCFGVLNLKVPTDVQKREDFSYIQVAYEVAKSAAQSNYPHIKDVIDGGQCAPGEYEYDRQTRIAVNQGVKLLSQQGSTIKDLPTLEITWFRPSKYNEIDDADCREFFYDNFPDGCRVVYIGNTYAESRNESMDDHWEIAYPIQGKGQITPSVGALLLPVQDAFIDLTDLRMETYLKAIPPIFGLKSVFEFAAYAKQQAVPGQNWPVKEPPVGMSIADCAWQPTPGELPQSASAFYDELLSQIPQTLVGLFAPAIGDSDPQQETMGGTLALRDASLGQQGVAWKAFRRAYCKSAEQLVLIEAYYRQAETDTYEVQADGFSYDVDLEDLRNCKLKCVPASDQDFPESFQDQQRNFLNVVQLAIAGSQQANAWLNEPGNAPLMEKYLSIPGSVTPGNDPVQKQKKEIQLLLQSSPVPKPAYNAFKVMGALQATTTGTPAPDPADVFGPFPADQLPNLFTPSLGIDAFSDNSEVELKTVIDWMNSSAGQIAKTDNPSGYLNVKIHAVLHQQEVAKKTQAAGAQVVQHTAETEAAKQEPKNAAETKKGIALEREKRVTALSKSLVQ